jgi:large subunit ribosomal protein L30e
MDTASLSKVLRDAMKTGKFAVGAKESIAGMKGSKALLCTKSVPTGIGAKLRAEAEKYKVPVVEVPISSAELAKLIGRPFNVSAMTLRSVSESDLRQILK